MIERCTHTAAPYANAAFDIALALDRIPTWQHFLDQIAIVARTPQIRKLLDDPRVTAAHLLDFARELLTPAPDNEQTNFLRLLLHYRRFRELPQIAAGFADRSAGHDKRCPAKITGARALTPAQQQQITAALSRHVGQDIVADCTVDPALLGGATLEAQNQIIDGSIRGRLERLGKHLRAA